MADARRARAEQRATRVAQTAPTGPAGVHRSSSPVVNAATDPDSHKQQGSSQAATELANVLTATPSLVRASGSASRARTEMPHDRSMLTMATELLRYRPAPDRHNDCLQRSEELIVPPPPRMARTQSPGRKRVPVTGLANPGKGREMKLAVRWFLGRASTCARSRR
ncbi:hypothetical protein D1007_17121 [Hordeum vulgare]|nr:hypothetical protein D1007_17121 [Hordeum vulgare]